MDIRQFGSRTPFKNRFLQRLYWSLRRCQFFICFTEDEVEEDAEDTEDPFTTRPPSLEELQRLTGFNRKWIMFLYRNFKQHCTNGRMSDQEWRAVCRLMFPCSADDRFADRLYKAITKDRGTEKILFKDLVVCLWELTESGRSSKFVSEQPFSTTAQFVFGLMSPDEKNLVDEARFVEYVRCVFALGARKQGTNNTQLGLPAAPIYRTKSADDDLKPNAYVIRRLAIDKFRALDTNNDGFITVEDIEREMENNRNTIILKSINDFNIQDTKPLPIENV
ncbi:unnamed protein product [Auanema sp. JU1783]|nr:unnamed protein product [Auanema sp. JU1783]